MFAEVDLDIALICTPSGNHLEPATAAAEYGRNVEMFLDTMVSDEPYELDGYEARQAVAIVRAGTNPLRSAVPSC